MTTPKTRQRTQTRALRALVRILLQGLCCVGLGLWATACQDPPLPARSERPLDGAPDLILVHTNDLHGQVRPRPALWLRQPNPPLAGGLERIAGYIQAVRAEARASGSAVLVLDAGDWTQGTPEGALEGGRAYLRVLAAMGYDAVCIGNHEFDHGVEALESNLAEVDLPAVLANVRRSDGGPLPGVPAYRMFERGGSRIAVVGLLTPDTARITHPSARQCVFLDPAETLDTLSEELAGRADWILPLTHLGVEGDRELARRVPGLELIVGGHSHSVLHEGLLEGSTRIVQVGSKASAVGRVDVWFDRSSGRVARLQARLVELFREPRPEHRQAQVRAACRQLLETGSERLDEPLGRLAAPMLRAKGALESSSAGNLITDAMRAATGADVALHNRGGIRANLYAGVVTRRDLFELAPFSNHLVLLTLSGRELEACVRWSVEGQGRRGPEVSGMEIVLRRGPRGVEWVELRVAGEPVEAERDYTLVTNSFLAAGGDGYDCFEQAGRRRTDPRLLRDVLAGVFAGKQAVSPAADSRYRFVD